MIQYHAGFFTPSVLIGHMLPRGDEMKIYLRELKEWGEDTKKKLQQSSISENNRLKWYEQISDWQSEIEEYLNRDMEINDEDIQLLQSRGKKIFESLSKKEGESIRRVPYGKHKLPPLPYRYDALEPYISEQIMRLHHDEHHKSYVDGLNKAEEAIYKGKYDNVIKHWYREQAFHGSGHHLHTIFRNNMTPKSAKQPIGEVAERINKDFGSWKKFKNLFTETAASVEGVGWAVLLWNPRNARLGIQTFEKHQLFQIADSIPLLVLDMWEHAYYLQYRTDKEAYIRNWWNVVNWENVNDRYKEASKLIWKQY